MLSSGESTGTKISLEDKEVSSAESTGEDSSHEGYERRNDAPGVQ